MSALQSSGRVSAPTRTGGAARSSLACLPTRTRLSPAAAGHLPLTSQKVLFQWATSLWAASRTARGAAGRQHAFLRCRSRGGCMVGARWGAPWQPHAARRLPGSRAELVLTRVAHGAGRRAAVVGHSILDDQLEISLELARRGVLPALGLACSGAAGGATGSFQRMVPQPYRAAPWAPRHPRPHGRARAARSSPATPLTLDGAQVHRLFNHLQVVRLPVCVHWLEKRHVVAVAQQQLHRLADGPRNSRGWGCNSKGCTTRVSATCVGIEGGVACHLRGPLSP